MLVFLWSLGGVAGWGATAPAYRIQDLGAFPFTAKVSPTAINAFGQIVGTMTGVGFFYDGATLNNLGNVAPMGINDLGQVVGNTGTQQFVYQRGVTTVLNTQSNFLPNLSGYAGQRAAGINNAGQIAVAFSYPAPDGGGGSLIYSLSAGDISMLFNPLPEAINGLGEIVTQVELPLTVEYFTAESSLQAHPLISGPIGAVTAINRQGDFVGSHVPFAVTSSFPSGPGIAFLQIGTQETHLGTLAGDSTSAALGVNASDQVVGTSGAHLFLYSPKSGLVDLSTLVPLSDGTFAGFTALTSAPAINDAGQIAGAGTYFNGVQTTAHLYLLTPLGQAAGVPPTVVPNQSAPAGSAVTFGQLIYDPQNQLNFQWLKNGVAITGAASATYAIARVQPTDAGAYSVQITNLDGIVTSSTGALTVTPAIPSRLVNLSASATLSSGSRTLTVGFYIGGSGTKSVLVRGPGPALAAFGVANAISDPQVTLFQAGGGILAVNAGWGASSALVPALTLAFAQTGAFAFAPASTDAALLLPLSAGGYSGQDVSGHGNPGLAFAEIYDADAANSPTRLVNLSASGPVAGAAQPLTAGFVVSGSAGETVIVRGLGPALAAFGLTGTLGAPQITLFDHTGAALASNAGWSSSSLTAPNFAAVGAFPLAPGSADAALAINLPGGSYTVQVTGVAGASGLAMVEIYESP